MSRRQRQRQRKKRGEGEEEEGEGEERERRGRGELFFVSIGWTDLLKMSGVAYQELNVFCVWGGILLGLR